MLKNETYPRASFYINNLFEYKKEDYEENEFGYTFTIIEIEKISPRDIEYWSYMISKNNIIKGE